MKRNETAQLSFRYTSIAIITGILILLLTYGLEAFMNDEPLTVYTLVKFHSTNFIIWIVDALVLVSVFFAFYIGRSLHNELSGMSKELEQEHENIERVLLFAEQLREGQIETEYTVESEKDTLGKTLVGLRDQLRKNRDAELLRQREESQRHWVAAGVAQFSDILRHNMNDIRLLTKEIVSNLVNYMHVNQAGFYNIVEDEDGVKYFELVAIYAFGRDKYPDQKIAWGEGLIGACALEKQTIHLTEVPDSYITITSGLGDSNPRSLVITPLQYNDEVHGVLELASFNHFEEYQVRFIERIAENIASTLASVKTNEKTAQLLKESQTQAEKMAMQEEFMRQNMQELEATQQEAAKQSEEFISFSNSVNLSMLRAEFDLDGHLIFSNEKFNQALEIIPSPDAKIHVSSLIDRRKLEWFERYWMEIVSKQAHFEGEVAFVTANYNQVWTVAAFSSVVNLEGKLEKVLFLGIDISSHKVGEQQNKALLDAINQATLKLEFKTSGEVSAANERFMKLLRYSNEEIKSFTMDDILVEDHKRNFKTIWQNIVRGIPYEGRMGLLDKMEEKHWLYGTFTLISSHGGQGEDKVVFLANDITHQVEIEEKSKIQTKKLLEQEEQLRASREDLSKRLREAKEEMRGQYREIELVKALSEKTLEGTLDAIVSINQFGKIEFFNEAAEELWGVEKKQVLGKNIEDILPPLADDSTEEEEYMGEYLRISDEPVLRQRTEVFFVNQLGQRESVLLTLAEAKEAGQYRLTGFIQKVEVELF